MSSHLDGNVLGGELGELFTVDITTATGQCASCGATGTIAQTMVYTDAPGLIARCPACATVPVAPHEAHWVSALVISAVNSSPSSPPSTFPST